MKPKLMAKIYRERFGISLFGRLRIISHRHPNVVAPNFISWEGEPITGADTTEKVRNLMRQISYSD